MTVLRDLDHLDLQSLVELLASHAPAPPELGSGEWLGVIEILTLRLADDFHHTAAEIRGSTSEAVAYVLDAAVAMGAIDEQESVVRRLNMSLMLLRQESPDADVYILDPDRIVRLLLDNLPMSAEEARVLSTDWRNLDIGQIRRLRAVKNMLSPGLPIARMASRGESRQFLQDWERVFPALP